MSFNVLMPALSPTMEKGNLAKWLVKEGDPIKSGQVIAEIETDKATMEYETADEGIMGKILVPAGTEDVAVGTKIAVILEEGESAADAAAAPVPATPAIPPKGEVNDNSSPATVPSSQQGDGARKADEGAQAARHNDRIIASPLAKRLAAQAGIDLSKVQGSGPGGRVVKADLDVLIPASASASAVAPTSALAAKIAVPAVAVAPVPASAPADIPVEEIKLSNMRKTIARRLSESKQQVPHIYLTIDCVIDKLLVARKDLNDSLSKSGVKLSVNDLIIKAVALALKKVPEANVQYAGDKMYKFGRADISVAVSIPGGLITPVIRDAANKGLGAISSEMAALAEKARAGKLQPDEYAGGTFSISNMGMMGIKDFCAVINPPQAGILAIGAGEQRAIVKNGAVAIATVMSVTGSFDHRVIDGAVGAEFLAAFKGYVEDPLTMLA
jgi:pyruvate dehydrogenase E2 component (dihydrolipoamide acetyltransferase)